MRVAESIELDAETKRELQALSKARRVEARLQQRARVIKLAVRGWQNKDIAREPRLAAIVRPACARRTGCPGRSSPRRSTHACA
jgi:FixJ family two-component response regulator